MGTYRDIVEKQRQEYNSKQLSLPNLNHFNEDTRNLKIQQYKDVNRATYKLTLEADLPVIKKAIGILTESKNKTKYPMLTSEEGRIAGEMQLQAAKNLLATKDNGRILSEYKQALELNRLDFASTIFDEVNSNPENYYKGLKEEFYKSSPFVDQIRDLYSGHMAGKEGGKFSETLEKINDLQDAEAKANHFIKALDAGFDRVYFPGEEIDLNEALQYRGVIQKQRNLSDSDMPSSMPIDDDLNIALQTRMQQKADLNAKLPN